MAHPVVRAIEALLKLGCISIGSILMLFSVVTIFVTRFAKSSTDEASDLPPGLVVKRRALTGCFDSGRWLMQHGCSLSIRGLTMRYLPTLLLIVVIGTSAESFEVPPQLAAVDVVSPSLIRGPNHQVRPVVDNDGLTNMYTIDTQFGEFVANGDADLQAKIREIDALAYLQAVSRSDVFVQALKDAGIGSVESIVRVFTNPVQSITGLPSGVRKLFSGYARSAERGLRGTQRMITGQKPDELQPDEFRKRNELLSDRERQWAFELQTDPYTTNMKLRAAISDMAVVQFVGGLPVDIALPVTASLAIGVLGGVDERIYLESARELESENRRCLAKQGIKDSQIDEFMVAPYLTPTIQTAFCSHLSALRDVDNVAEMAAQLAASESFAEARFLASATRMLADYAQQEPLKSVVADESVPQAITMSGHLVVMLPVDYLFWTSETAATVQRMSRLADEAGTDSSTLWTTGRLSDRTRTELRALGWQTQEINGRL